MNKKLKNLQSIIIDSFLYKVLSIIYKKLSMSNKKVSDKKDDTVNNLHLMVMTKSEYDDLAIKDINTLYFIKNNNYD